MNTTTRKRWVVEVVYVVQHGLRNSSVSDLIECCPNITGLTPGVLDSPALLSLGRCLSRKGHVPDDDNWSCNNQSSRELCLACTLPQELKTGIDFEVATITDLTIASVTTTASMQHEWSICDV